MPTWMQIGSALLVLFMIIFMFPQAKRMLKESPKGSASDWMGFVIPIGLVVLFVLLLMSIV